MDYQPMSKDLFKFVDVFNSDLLQELNRITQSQCALHQTDLEDDGFGINISLAQDWQDDCYLDAIRWDASEEFRRNGIEQELDDVDVYQAKLRERTMAQPSMDLDPVARDYMRQKKGKSKKTKMVCVFCKNNNELPATYKSHVLKDSQGRTTCPVLRRYTCPICGVKGGDEAHTIRYCPKNIDKDLNPGLGMLMKSPHLSTGKLNPRYNPK